MRQSLVLVGAVSVLFVAGVSWAVAETAGLFGGHVQTERNREAAFRDASQLLGRLRLPAGASLQRTIPPAKLSALEAAQNHADAGEVWTASGTMSSATAYLKAHPPSGSKVNGGGYSANGKHVTGRNVVFSWPAVADVLADRTMNVSVSASGPGRVKIYAQAESIWLTARRSGERIPGRTRSIDIAVRHAHRVLKATRVTRSADVARIVAAFNEVPVVQPVAYSCPLVLPRLERKFSYTFLGVGGRVLATARYEIGAGSSPGPCNSIAVTIRGDRQRDLLGGAPIIGVQRSLGIRTAG